MTLTTNYQDRVLNILRWGGSLLRTFEEKTFDLTDEQGNTETCRNDTIKKLHKLKFIQMKMDHPAIGIISYVITHLGEQWLIENKIEPYNPF